MTTPTRRAYEARLRRMTRKRRRHHVRQHRRYLSRLLQPIYSTIDYFTKKTLQDVSSQYVNYLQSINISHRYRTPNWNTR